MSVNNKTNCVINKESNKVTNEENVFGSAIKANGTFPGVLCKDNGFQFTVAYRFNESLILKLYDRSEKLISTIDMSEYKICGDIYSLLYVTEDDFLAYEYVVDGKTSRDPYEIDHINKRSYGILKDDTNAERSSVSRYKFDWADDKTLNIPFDEVIAYTLHVRGFTKHNSSKVKYKGTYRGVAEKSQYLKELGINQVILMPCYDFYEFDSEKDSLPEGHPKYQTSVAVDAEGNEIDNSDTYKLNYWGFKKGSYYCPKANYAASEDFIAEFKTMVKDLHSSGIEIILQFLFEKDENAENILNILRYWRTEYHIDGFYIMGSDIPKKLIASDYLLSDSKLYFEYINLDEIGGKANLNNRFAAEISKGFLVDARRFLKSDDDSLGAFIKAQRYNPKDIHKINYLTCYEGFTLNDLVSYDYKHNELNGEDNRDGSSYNYSWNCGVEGESRKKTVKELRLRQMKNAFALLLLSQATPMFLMGDELMNTQFGNNNPYCIDDETNWLIYSSGKQKAELFSFVKELIKFRKEHKLLHLKDELSLIDYKSLGAPDISYHQDMAWKSRTDSFIKHIGVMLNGDYADGEDSIYIAYNMHWENHLFGLPRLEKNKKWEYVFDTSNEYTKEDVDKELSDNPETLCVYKRSVLVLKAVTKIQKNNKKNNNKV